MITIRPGTPEDAQAICEVHVSDVKEPWRRFAPDGTSTPARYEELTVPERLSYGGAWMDPGKLRVHLEGVLASGQWLLVAESQGRLVGEIEIYVGPDPDWGRTAHIDMLQVHHAEQRRGAGRALVAEGLRRAREAGCRTYSVSPETTAIEFYAKCGITEVLERTRDLVLPLSATREDPRAWYEPGPLDSFVPLESRPLVLGLYQSSYATWVKGRWRLADPTDLRSDEGAFPDLDAHVRLRQFMRREATAVLQAWAPRTVDLVRLLGACAARARSLGYDTLETTVGGPNAEQVDGLGGRLGAEFMLLGRRFP